MKSRVKRNRKNYLIIALTAVLVLAVSGGITYAWLIASDAKTNTFTVGEVKTEIDESGYQPPDKLEPGITFPKDPKVVNTGTMECFVRMKVVYSVPGAAQWCQLKDLPEAGWIDGHDGWYYYEELLQPGEQTEPLFHEVEILTHDADGTAVTEADMVNFEILIYTESVEHSSHEGSCDADEYRKVWADYE